MYAFYMSLDKPASSHTENRFRIWRSHNHNVRMNLNWNKLANFCRRIINKRRLIDRTRYVNQRENEHHIAALDDIPVMKCMKMSLN